MVYVGIYALIYPHTILSDGIVSRDGLPRGVLPSGIFKIEKYCPGVKVPVSLRTGRTSLILKCPHMDELALGYLFINITIFADFTVNGIHALA